MTETTRQRWLVGVLGVAAVVLGLLELRDVPKVSRLLALLFLTLGSVLGFLVLYARELHLRRTGKRPADTPGKEQMTTLIIVGSGIGVLASHLLDPIINVLVYGVFAGLMMGFFLFIGNDLRRLGGLDDSETGYCKIAIS